MTQEQKALEMWLSKPRPQLEACGCIGAQTISTNPDRDENGMMTGPRYPVCPCRMEYVQELDGNFYSIDLVNTKFSANLIGPVGGPYVL